MRTTAFLLFSLLHFLGTSALPTAEPATVSPDIAPADDWHTALNSTISADSSSHLARRDARSCARNAPGQIRIAVRGKGLPLARADPDFTSRWEPCHNGVDLEFITIDRRVADGARFTANVRIPGDAGCG
jgi:hypothetical protein